MYVFKKRLANNYKKVPFKVIDQPIHRTRGSHEFISIIAVGITNRFILTYVPYTSVLCTLLCTKQYRLQLIILIYNIIFWCKKLLYVFIRYIQKVWLKQHCTSIHRCRLVHLYICNLLHITEIFSHRCGLNLKINLIYHKD